MKVWVENLHNINLPIKFLVFVLVRILLVSSIPNFIIKILGHFGVIQFPYTILHPYYLSEVVQILNKVCPACKSLREDLWIKVRYLTQNVELRLLSDENFLRSFYSVHSWLPGWKYTDFLV